MEEDSDNGIVRMEIPELEKFISDTVTRMSEESEIVEKLDDYDRLRKETVEMRKKMEELEAKVTAQAKQLAGQAQTTMKAEDEPDAVEDEDEDENKKKSFPPKKKGDDDEDEEPAAKSEAETELEELKKEMKELKESPLYKAQQNVEIEDAETAPAASLLGNIVGAHYGGI